MKLNLIGTLLLVFTIVAAFNSAKARNDGKQPNMVFIMGDDIEAQDRTALCSPTRGAFLTGRNHHSIGLAAITEAATGFPSNFGSIPKSAATIAETLKQNGYNTLAFGKWHLAPYTAILRRRSFIRWRHRSFGEDHTVTAHVTIPERGAEGVLACFGGEFGGWSLFIQDGKLKYVHNYVKLEEFAVESNVSVPAGKHEIAFRFVPTEKSHKPDYFIGDVTLMIDGKEVGSRKGIKSAGQYSAVTGYGLVTGRNPNTSVTHKYETPLAFTGDLEKATIVLHK